MTIVIPAPKRLFNIVLLALAAILALTAESCGSTVSNQQSSERQIVASQQAQYQRVQPPPYFDKSLERQEMIKLYEARNKAVSTFSYVQNQYTGKIMFQCASIGYPLPYSIQITSPETIAFTGSGTAIGTMPQGEPNGLFPPPTASGTWIMCLNDDGTVAPSYHEPLVQTFPYPMKEVNGELVRSDNNSTLHIDIATFKNGSDGTNLNATGAISTQVAANGGANAPTATTNSPRPKT